MVDQNARFTHHPLQLCFASWPLHLPHRSVQKVAPEYKGLLQIASVAVGVSPSSPAAVSDPKSYD